MLNFFKKNKEVKKEEAPAINKIAGAAFPILSAPFNGVTVLVKVRCLNRTQLRAVGEFNLIDLSGLHEFDKVSLQDTIDLINWQEALIKETLVSPTFEEIQSYVYGTDNRLDVLKKRIKEIREKIALTEPEERKKLSKEADGIELYIGSLLPNDFMNFITEWATGVNRSDIKKLTRDMLLEAAILATRGHDNPADHVQGEFLDIHIDEINKSSWIVYNQFLEDKEKENAKSEVLKGKKVITGGRVKG